jgi:hypothetical protein
MKLTARPATEKYASPATPAIPHDPWTLRQERADHEQPYGGVQHDEHVGNRSRDPQHRHGRSPGQREPGDAQGDAEQIRRNPQARQPLSP